MLDFETTLANGTNKPTLAQPPRIFMEEDGSFWTEEIYFIDTPEGQEQENIYSVSAMADKLKGRTEEVDWNSKTGVCAVTIVYPAPTAC